MKPKLIMLHGALGAYEKMHKLGNRMSDHYDVVGFTMKGHGEDANSPGFSIADFVDQLSDFVKYHKYQRYAILGYSLGGYVALSFALTKPQGLEKIFTFGTKFIWSEEFALAETSKLKPEILEEHMPFLATWMKQIHGSENWVKVVKNTADLMNEVGRQNYLMNADLSIITCPILITQGSEDPMVPQEESQIFASKIPSANFHLFPKVGHEPNELSDEQLTIFR